MPECLWGLMGLPSCRFCSPRARKRGAFQGMSNPSRKHKSPICQSGLFLLPLEYSVPFPHLPSSLVWGQGQSCLLGRRRLPSPSLARGGGRWTPRLLAPGPPLTRPPSPRPTQLPHTRSFLPGGPTKAEGERRSSGTPPSPPHGTSLHANLSKERTLRKEPTPPPRIQTPFQFMLLEIASQPSSLGLGNLSSWERSSGRKLADQVNCPELLLVGLVFLSQWAVREGQPS